MQWDGEGDGGGREEACSPPAVSCLCRGRWDSHREGPLSPARRGGVVTGGYGPVRPHLQAPSACRGQGHPGEGGGAWTRSIGKAATFLRSHRREAAELEFEWGGIEGRALTAAAAPQRKPLFSTGSAPSEQRTPSSHVSRRPARASHQAARPSPLSPQPHLEARPPAAAAAQTLSSLPPHQCQLLGGRAGRVPTPSGQTFFRGRSLPAATPSPHTGAERWYPRLPKMPASEEKPPLSYSLCPQ